MDPERSDTYKTIIKPADGIFKDKGSKFLGFACPVNNEEEVKQIVNRLRKEYHDARHHCYAYRLGYYGEAYRTNDDGEPSGTAGRPIYGQILSAELTQVLIVVVRYFGGTLLGTSGLIHAYKAAAEDCIHNSRIIEKTITRKIRIVTSYEQLNLVMRLVKDENLEIVDQNFESGCVINLAIRLRDYDRIIHKIQGFQEMEVHEQ